MVNYAARIFLISYLYILTISLCEASCCCTSSIYELTNFCCNNYFSMLGRATTRVFSLDSEHVVRYSGLGLNRFLLVNISSRSNEHSSTRVVCLALLFKILLDSVSKPPCDKPSTTS